MFQKNSIHYWEMIPIMENLICIHPVPLGFGHRSGWAHFGGRGGLGGPLLKPAFAECVSIAKSNTPAIKYRDICSIDRDKYYLVLQSLMGIIFQVFLVPHIWMDVIVDHWRMIIYLLRYYLQGLPPKVYPKVYPLVYLLNYPLIHVYPLKS